MIQDVNIGAFGVDGGHYQRFTLDVPVIKQDLLLHYDAVDTRSYSGAGSVWQDLSISARSGTLRNTTYNEVSGIEFGGINSDVLLPSTINLSGEFTASFLGRIDSYGGRDLTGTIPFTGDYIQFSNTSQVGLFTSTAFTNINVNPPSGFYNMDITRDSSDVVRIYFGAKLNGIGSIGGSLRISALGQRGDGTRFLLGVINNFRVYNRCLSPEELAYNYNVLRKRFPI